MAVLDLGSGERSLLSESLDRNCAPFPPMREPIWMGERMVVFAVEDGGNTHLCPIGQAEQLFTVLRLLKRDVELVRFPGESHELTRSGAPAHRVMRFEILLDWFGERLKPSP